MEPKSAPPRHPRPGDDPRAWWEAFGGVGPVPDETVVVDDGGGLRNVLVYLEGGPNADVPVIAVSEASHVPYVLDTRLVRVRAGEGFPVDRIARALAGALGEDGTALAARLPVVRDAVVDELIRSFSRKNGIVGVAVFIPGVDMPLMTMNQIRLVLRIALAYGESMDASRAGELLGVIGAGFGLRAVARQTLGAVPVAGWAVKGGIGYTGTKAIGEAARRYFETRST